MHSSSQQTPAQINPADVATIIIGQEFWKAARYSRAVSVHNGAPR